MNGKVVEVGFSPGTSTKLTVEFIKCQPFQGVYLRVTSRLVTETLIAFFNPVN